MFLYPAIIHDLQASTTLLRDYHSGKKPGLFVWFARLRIGSYSTTCAREPNAVWYSITPGLVGEACSLT
jgi:hypothetical protein